MASENDLYDFVDDDPPAATAVPIRRVAPSAPPGAPQGARANRTLQPAVLGYRGKGAAVATPGRKLVGPDRWKEQTELEIARREWLVPTIALGVCSVLFLLMGVLTAGVEGLAIFGIVFVVLAVVNTIMAVIAAFLAGMVGIGTGGTILATVLQLAAASSIALTARVGFETAVGMGGMFSLMIYVGVLMIVCQLMLDMDGADAQVFAFIFCFLQFLATIGAIALLFKFGLDFPF